MSVTFINLLFSGYFSANDFFFKYKIKINNYTKGDRIGILYNPCYQIAKLVVPVDMQCYFVILICHIQRYIDQGPVPRSHLIS